MNSRACEVCQGRTNQSGGVLALANVDDKGSGDGMYVDPFTREVLDLETRVGGCLE